MDLKRLRRRIDAIDCEIVALLKERFDLGLRASRRKIAVRDPAREAEVLARVRGAAARPCSAALAEELFRRIIEESCAVQEAGPRLVGFQGQHGAYSERAALAMDPDCVPMPCVELSDVFAGVEGGDLDAGVVPVENTVEGQVARVDEALAASALCVVAELIQPVHHALLAPPGASHRELRVVYSHPQALGQCRDFLSRNGLEARPCYDTAGAARMVARDANPGTAAVASAACADIYDLEVIKDRIEDDASNATRFVMISRTPAPRGDKCSLAFVTANEAGSLHAALRAFAEAGINLTRIASAPSRLAPGNYLMSLDLEGSAEDPRVTAAMGSVRRGALHFRFLGCYGAAATGWCSPDRDPGAGGS
jgi:prephenate dehydratase/chorismate mutase